MCPCECHGFQRPGCNGWISGGFCNGPYPIGVEPEFAEDLFIQVDGRVDLTVSTRDIWSLAPELSISRSGGETRTRIGLEEINLLGRGQRLRVLRDEDIDRNENIVEFSDQHLGRSWVSLLARYADNSDGNTSVLSVVRPFYALDTRWAAGGTIYDDDRRDKLYQYGEAAAEYRHERDYGQVFGGWSRGLVNGRVRRWTIGAVFETVKIVAPFG